MNTSALVFRSIFGCEPEASADAPGRVNMIGDHTDYNEGFVLPIAIPQRTQVSLARAETGPHVAHSATLHETISFEVSSPHGFARYIAGCIGVLQARGVRMPPLRILVRSSVPVGVGLSSSAALEVATLRALNDLLGLGLDAIDIARLAQRAEIEYSGVQCGIMDQMASSIATTDQMLLIDTRTLETRLTPLPAGAQIVVVDSGVSRDLSSSAYNARRQECAQAAALLGAVALRDVTDIARVERLPSPLRERARHVISENVRVLQAAAQPDAAAFGALMNQSHQSLRDDFAVSTPGLDELVAALQEHEAVFGARMTGAGFGGACVALARAGAATSIAQHLVARGLNGARIIVPQSVAAAD